MPSSTISSERARVLLVDDNEAMLARARAVLSPHCSIVGAVKGGQAAIDSAPSLHPDVIVLDISMPEMSGLEVAERLKRSGSAAAIVFLTVHDEEEFLTAARVAGAIGYVVKSRLTLDLATAVRDAAAGRPFVSPSRPLR